MKDRNIKSRKDDHIRINLEENVSSSLINGLEKYRFIHCALPEMDIREINLSQTLFGRQVSVPLLISSMTGGTEQAFEINQSLALAAEKFRLAIGVGSQRAGIEDSSLSRTFNMRAFAPNALIFSNLGAVQLNYGYGLDECKQAVDMTQADCLLLHLNPLQEAIQPEGDTNFKGLLQKIEKICKELAVPVIVKEVGWGISVEIAEKLVNCGVAGIDVAGAGGTSWSQVERFRLSNQHDIHVADAFKDWGIPTTEALIAVKAQIPEIPVFASGGLKTGMDIAKSIALGADLAGMASVFLKAATNSLEQLFNTVQEFEKILRISMFATGSKDLSDFKKGKIQRIETEYGPTAVS